MGCKSSEKPKTKHRKGLWSPEEDQKLRNHVVKHGLGCWSSVPINAGLQRNGKSCRLRWINYLRPGLKRGMFTPQEEETILTLHHLLGNKWSQIAQSLPGRTDNEIKNHWHTYLKKRISKVEELEAQARTHYSSSSSENTESMVSPQNLTDQMPSFDSFHHIEKSSIISNELQISPVPKLLFAEWLSLDQESGSFSNSAKPAASSDGFNHVSTSNFQDPFMNNAYLLNEGAFGSDLLDGLNDASVNELFSSQFISENEFVGSISGNDLWNDFNMNNDVMYI